MNPVDPIIEKLRKLVAHEKSARSMGSINEAEAFAAKIQDMLEEHKLGMDEVAYSEREVNEPINWERVSADELDINGKVTKVYWQVQLATAIARANSCQNVNHTGGKAFSFVGRTTDRELCKILYIYLVELGDEMCEKAARDDRERQRGKFESTHCIRGGKESYMPWDTSNFRNWMGEYRDSWKIGFSDAIAARLMLQHTSAEVKASGTVALVHMKKDAVAIKEFLDGKTKKDTGNKRNDSNRDGYDRGESTGSAVALTPNTFAPRSSGKVVGLLN